MYSLTQRKAVGQGEKGEWKGKSLSIRNCIMENEMKKIFFRLEAPHCLGVE